MNKLEPFNQLNLFGLDKYFLELVRIYENNLFPNKLLLNGPKGIGKSTLAYHFINFVLSQNEDYRYNLKDFKINSDSSTFKTILNKSNTNLMTVDINRDKKSIDIDQIKPFLLYTGASDPRKNVRRLLEAYSKLPQELYDYNLVLAGKLLIPEIELIDTWITAYNISSSKVILLKTAPEIVCNSLRITQSLVLPLLIVSSGPINRNSILETIPSSILNSTSPSLEILSGVLTLDKEYPLSSYHCLIKFILSCNSFKFKVIP